MPSVKLGQIGSGGKIKYHEISWVGDTILRQHGQVGGKAIEVPPDTYSPEPVDKAGKSPAQRAYEKHIYDLTRKGYQVVNDYSEVVKQTVDVKEIFTTLPDSLCMSKPETSISPAAYAKLIKRGRFKLQLKENGNCHFMFLGGAYGSVITTRRMFDHTAKYADIVREAVAAFPPITMVVVELYVDAPGLTHMQRYNRMGSISKADTHKGRINDPELPNTKARRAEFQVRARVLAVPIYDGKLTLQLSEESWAEHRKGITGPLLTLPPDLPTHLSHEEMLQLCMEADMEGAVIWDLDTEMKLTMTGIPARCACWKVKPPYEADVLATGWVPEKNKNNGKIGALIIREFFEEEDGTKHWVERGTCGSGLTDETSDPAKWTFPCVIKLLFSERYEDTNNFQFPRIVGVHEDKTPEELEEI